MTIAEKAMNSLGKIQESQAIKFLESSVLLTSVAAITNIAVGILRCLGSVICVAIGQREAAAFGSAFRQVAWGGATLIPLVGGAIALGILGVKVSSYKEEIGNLKNQNQVLQKQMRDVSRGLKGLKLRELKLPGTNQTCQELNDKGFSIVPMELKDIDKEYPIDTQLEEMLTAQDFDEFKKVVNMFEGKKPNVLSLIGFQNDTLFGGSMPGPIIEDTQKKIWENLENFIKNNEFDAIILPFDNHPKKHKSFSETFFNVSPKGNGCYSIEPNDEGKKRGAQMTIYSRPSYNFSKTSGDYIHKAGFKGKRNLVLQPLKEKTQKDMDEGRLMFFGKMLQPIAMHEAMFNQLENYKEIFNKLKKIGLLDEDGQINGEYQLPNYHLKLKEAFECRGDPRFLSSVEWDDTFLKGLSEQLNKDEGITDKTKTKKILNSLLVTLWPNHCVQNTKGRQFHEKLVELLAKHGKHLPIIPIAIGASENSGEAYSAVVNTQGDTLSSSYLPLLKALNVKNNVVCDFSGKLTAEDAQKYGINTTYWSPDKQALPIDLESDGVSIKKSSKTKNEKKPEKPLLKKI